MIGLLFTLRTHAATIWNIEVDEKRAEVAQMSASHASATTDFAARQPSLARQYTHEPGEIASPNTTANIRDSQLYKRILGQSLRQVGLSPTSPETRDAANDRNRSISSAMSGETPHVVPPKDPDSHSLHIEGLSDEQNSNVVRAVAEVAATAAAVAARDARVPRKASHVSIPKTDAHRPALERSGTIELPDPTGAIGDAATQSGGHDAPNWSRTKSAVILLSATVAYAIIAEILVNNVDTVLGSGAIDEKFLGITLFALVPNATEFLVSVPRTSYCFKAWHTNA